MKLWSNYGLEVHLELPPPRANQHSRQSLSQKFDDTAIFETGCRFVEFRVLENL